MNRRSLVQFEVTSTVVLQFVVLCLRVCTRVKRAYASRGCASLCGYARTTTRASFRSLLELHMRHGASNESILVLSKPLPGGCCRSFLRLC